jgi:hypothetical protein
MKMNWEQPVPKAAKAFYEQNKKNKESVLRPKIYEKFCPKCKNTYDSSKGQSRCFHCFSRLPRNINI